MGLERIVATLNGEKTVYNTDIFDYIIEKIENVLKVKYSEEDFTDQEYFLGGEYMKFSSTPKKIRIIADHTRTATIMISD
jgi:alanyl-tRNA synthetase